MVILEHNHAAQVIAMCVNTSDKHAVFLDNPEAGRCLSCSRYNAFPAALLRFIRQPP